MILLKQIRLINWYAFNQITVPVGFFTLIAGKNGNGKSVLLDAVKYALYGDIVFNKSTENKGSRTVSSYTRGLLDATAGTYMRPADKTPNVYTHIALEMEEYELNRTFILGTIIETDSGNAFKTKRYVIENKTLDGVAHTYEDNGRTLPYSASELEKLLDVNMLDVQGGLSKFMQRTGMRLNEQLLAAFRRKLRSIMSYDPDAKIDQFIRESVLEEKKVDFSKLIEAKNNIDALTASFEGIDAEIKELEELLKLFDEFQRAQKVIFIDDVKIEYKRFLNCDEALIKAKTNMDIAVRQMAEDDDKLESIDAREKEARNAHYEAQRHRDSLDCARAISEAEIALEKVQDEKNRLRNEQTELIAFQSRVNELFAWLYKEKLAFSERNVLSSLTTDRFTKIQKETSVIGFISELQKYRDAFFGNVHIIGEDLLRNQSEQFKWQQQIADCDAKKATFSQIPEYVKLKDEINKEFRKRGISSEARFACEYVLELTDEAWRDAIESHLGRKRYAILVEPEYFDIADDVFNASKNKYAHLYNTKLLMKKRITTQDDSVVQFITVKNPVAKQYFDYLLSRLHATTTENVRNFENAISKDGKISVAMDSYFLNFDMNKFYCLGQETIELNRIKAVKNLAAYKEEYRKLKEALDIENSKKAYLETAMSFFGAYNYDADWQYNAVCLDLTKKKEELEALKEAQKNNTEYMELVERVSRLKQKLDEVVNERSAVHGHWATMKALHKTSQDEAERLSTEKKTAAEKLKDLEITDNVVYAKAVEEYEKFVANGRTGVGGILKDRARAERARKEADENLNRGKIPYCARMAAANQKSLAYGTRADYEARKSRIFMDDMQEIQQKLKAQTKRYEEIFKNEFVLTVLKSCESARDDLKLINAELAHLEFKSQYAFEVKYVKDGSDYEKILEYAKYLKERENLGVASDQVVFSTMTSYPDGKGEKLEEDIKRIINKIVESNDREQIEHYADYRNYMTYEILITNDVLTKAKLSKQSGYNSGAEVQIPYMLILLSALLMIYNDKNNSTRLVFIDEPFAKMDPTNVKIMLGFMKKQNLQMIFCAPDKTELIGNACEVILPVLRTQPDMMEIGIIDMHKGA